MLTKIAFALIFVSIFTANASDLEPITNQKSTNSVIPNDFPQTNAYENMTNLMNCIDFSSCSWNFVEDAKNLTPEEKKYFNELANACRKSTMGMWNVEAISSRVKMLDNEREAEKILKKMQPSTNVVWLGSVVTMYWQKDGSNSWQTVGNMMQSLSSNPKFVIGLREDGVVVWKKSQD